jgi:large subunit ribosomal protein L29
MKADKIRGMDAAELKTKTVETTEQLFHLKFKTAMGQTDGVKKLRELKKDRARMLTILNEKARAEKK